MSKDQEPSKIEKQFVLDALDSGMRIDGRSFYNLRALKVQLGPKEGTALVQLGKTRVLTTVSAEVVRPMPNKPTEGVIRFHTEFSPMATPFVEKDSSSEDQVLLSRMLEKALRKSDAVDTEGLCIVAGEKVWEIRVDTRVLDHEGNVLDCACIAAVSALCHFRRPDVTLSGEDVTIHSKSEKNPIPLAIHHIPVCVSFVLFKDGHIVVVDPNLLEETVQDGQITFVLNMHKEVCALTKYGGCPLPPDVILNCANIASIKATEITKVIKDAVREATSKFEQ